MDDFRYKGQSKSQRPLMARNGCGLSEIARSLAHNTYRIIEDIIEDSIRDSFKGEIKMIVCATWLRRYETCKTHDAEGQMLNKQAFASASEKGATVHSVYVNRPEHTMFMVLKTVTLEQIDDFFDPLLEMAHTEISPVIIPKSAQ